MSLAPDVDEPTYDDVTSEDWYAVCEDYDRTMRQMAELTDQGDHSWAMDVYEEVEDIRALLSELALGIRDVTGDEFCWHEGPAGIYWEGPLPA